MFCLLEGPCEIIVNGKDLERYPALVQRVASQAVSYFGTDNYVDSRMNVGPNFSIPLLFNLLNGEEIEETRFRIVPLVGSRDEYIITNSHLYPTESVLMAVGQSNSLTLSHHIDRD